MWLFIVFEEIFFPFVIFFLNFYLFMFEFAHAFGLAGFALNWTVTRIEKKKKEEVTDHVALHGIDFQDSASSSICSILLLYFFELLICLLYL